MRNKRQEVLLIWNKVEYRTNFNSQLNLDYKEKLFALKFKQTK